MKKTTLFRKYLADSEILLAPVAHDALGGVIAEKVGFKSLLSAGFANSASLFAMPDHEVFFEYYTDNTYTELCGEKYVTCYGIYGWGCRTVYVVVYDGDDC